ncbi:uncharacterized protein BDR25DRAFT_348035 [Lindgomyces ingoldianus]|uniref:Uncharacterized protein n=1 Tax=Lindgomyces ingoldianus TaxID=673940 RepID=A0ACB6RGS9_9PLEO|nr:uncharacterized protein BDR25DRAFT_348035 [Lindgomyces ingoldianus]KAF2477717.1 hypothetical protein BDR25DRAFT_348035 [Lindgomyces ingoldianus]
MAGNYGHFTNHGFPSGPNDELNAQLLASLGVEFSVQQDIIQQSSEPGDSGSRDQSFPSSPSPRAALPQPYAHQLHPSSFHPSHTIVPQSNGSPVSPLQYGNLASGAPETTPPYESDTSFGGVPMSASDGPYGFDLNASPSLPAIGKILD